MQNLMEMDIYHQVTTYTGDSEEWKEQLPRYQAKSAITGDIVPIGCTGAGYIFFTDEVVVRHRKEELDFSRSSTLEMLIGPALMCFHIPFSVGIVKIIVATTPVEGHNSIMRTKTFVNSSSWFVKFVAWFVAGISASQLWSDIVIMCNKVRLRRPMRQHNEVGPGRLVDNWLKQFYSKSTALVGKGDFTEW
jgi:hypothetical protein